MSRPTHLDQVSGITNGRGKCACGSTGQNPFHHGNLVFWCGWIHSQHLLDGCVQSIAHGTIGSLAQQSRRQPFPQRGDTLSACNLEAIIKATTPKSKNMRFQGSNTATWRADRLMWGREWRCCTLVTASMEPLYWRTPPSSPCNCMRVLTTSIGSVHMSAKHDAMPPNASPFHTLLESISGEWDHRQACAVCRRCWCNKHNMSRNPELHRCSAAVRMRSQVEGAK